MNDHGSLKGGPFNAALDSAHKPQPLPRGKVCPQWIEAPLLVILRYRTVRRQFVLQFSGCSDVVILHDGSRLNFTTAGFKQVQAALERVS